LKYIGLWIKYFEVLLFTIIMFFIVEIEWWKNDLNVKITLAEHTTIWARFLSS